MIALAVLAAKTPTANAVVPGVLGFLVVSGMGLILFFLLRSMNKQLRRVAGGARWQAKPKSRESGGQSAEAANAAPGKPKAGPANAQGGPA